MLSLAWSNLWHNKVRTLLSALAVGIGIALMLVSRGLARGSISEVDQRMQSVDAELVVLPAQENIIFTGGAAFPPARERLLQRTADERGPLASAVIPTFFGQVKMGGQQQRLFGIDIDQMGLFLGPRRLLEGKLFDRAHRLARRIAALQAETGRRNVSELLGDADLEDGLELIIDERLRRVGETDPATGRKREYRVGDTLRVMGREFRIVGVVEAGVAGRVFAPIQTLRHIVNGGEPWSSMFFVKLRDGLDAGVAADALAAALGGDARVELKSEYGRLLEASFAQVHMYLNATSAVALVVCFLFILLTMYTVVLERTREIGILKSLGVTRGGLLRLSLIEAVLISGVGTLMGIGLAAAAKWGLGVKLPLLTVDLPLDQIGLALLIGVLGGALSALYPGWRAARLEPAVALSNE